MNKTKLNYFVDLIFFIQFLLVGYSGLVMYFNHHAAGQILRLIHDKIGILMLVFFVIHIVLHWKWIVITTKNLFSKKEMINGRRKLNYFVDLIFFVQFLLVGYSGLVMYINHQGAGFILHLIHDKIGILMLAFFVIHIVLHWKWIVYTTKNLFRRDKQIKQDEIVEANYMSLD